MRRKPIPPGSGKLSKQQAPRAVLCPYARGNKGKGSQRPGICHRMDAWFAQHTPESVQKKALWVVERLPHPMARWILRNKSKTIIIVFTIRGLFLRPTMWAVYLAIFAYFSA